MTSDRAPKTSAHFKPTGRLVYLRLNEEQLRRAAEEGAIIHLGFPGGHRQYSAILCQEFVDMHGPSEGTKHYEMIPVLWGARVAGLS